MRYPLRPPGPASPVPEPEGGPILGPVTRVALYVVVFFLLQIAVGGPVLMGWMMATGEDPTALSDGTLAGEVFLWVSLFLAPVLLATTHLFLRRIDRRPAAAIGLALPAGGRRRAAVEGAAAVVVALAVAGLWLAVAAAVSTWRFGGIAEELLRGPAWWPSPAGGVAAIALLAGGFLVQGAVEELAFRGYVFHALRDRWSWPTAAAASSAVFAVLHLGNPGAAAAGIVNTFLFGLLLAALVEATGSLLAASVLHGAWNFVVAALLSLPVSGLTTGHLLEIDLLGPPWATGGSFGPEGSWALSGLLAPLVLAAAAWADRRRAARARDQPAAGS